MYTLSVEDHSGAAESTFLQVVTAVPSANCVFITVVVVNLDAEILNSAAALTTDSFGTTIVPLAITVPDVLIVPGVLSASGFPSSTENITVSFDATAESSKIARGGTVTAPEA